VADTLYDRRAENFDEELGLGKAQRTYLVNNLAVLIAHRLQWDYQPDKRSRSWLLSMREHRSRVLFNVTDNPSLKSQFAELFGRAYDLAVTQAARETGLQTGAFPAACPYTWEDLANPLVEEETA
jgi:hypothetical protein